MSDTEHLPDPTDDQQARGAAPVQAKWEWQKAFFALCRDITSSLELKQVLGHLSHNSRRFFRADLVTIALIENGTITTATYEGLGQEYNFNDHNSAVFDGKGLSGRAFRTGQIASSNDYWHDPTIDHDPDIDAEVTERGIKALMLVPITRQGQVVGLLGLHKVEVYQWQPQDVERAEELATLAALAIHNSHIYAQMSALNQDLNDCNLEWEALQRFNQQLRGLTDLTAVTERVLTLAVGAVAGSGGVLFEARPTLPPQLATLIACQIAHTQPDSFVMFRPEETLPEWAIPSRSGEGLPEMVAGSGKAFFIADLLELKRNNPQLIPYPAADWCSAVFVPMYVNEKLIGVLGLVAEVAEHFSPQQLRFIEMLAARIALAIGESRLIESQKEQERLMAVLTMARTLAHDLNQPLAVLQAELDLVTELGVTPTEETFKTLQKMVKDMTTHIYDYQKIIRFAKREVLPGLWVIDRNQAINREF